MLFDSHAHYDDRRFDADREQLLASLPALGIGYVTNIGCSIQTSQQSIALANKFPFVYCTVGIHPHDAENACEEDLATLQTLSKEEKVRAIGEIGLDYFYKLSPRDIQKKWFHAQMELAKTVRLPVVIHDRDAHGDCYEVCKQHPDVYGVFHCYSGSLEYAKLILNLGYMLSFTGVITFKNARKFEEIIRYVPLDRIMIETDCPYLAPEPMRGNRNFSGYLPYIVQRIAEIKQCTPQMIEEITTKNAKQFFAIA